jgi:hypothetical protein
LECGVPFHAVAEGKRLKSTFTILPMQCPPFEAAFGLLPRGPEVAEKVGDRPTSKIKPPFMISGPFGIFDNIRAKVM